MTDIFRRSNNYHGKLDLAVANTGGTTVSILRGDGQGGFATPLAQAVDNAPDRILTADFDLGFFSSAPTSSDPAAEPAVAPRLYLPGAALEQVGCGADAAAIA